MSSHALRELTSVSDRILVDVSGGAYEEPGLPGDTPAPALVVAEVTEAVKQMEGAMVVDHPDRDLIWAVVGFLLDRHVVARLPDGIDSADRLIQAVTAAGFEWLAVLPVSRDPSR